MFKNRSRELEIMDDLEFQDEVLYQTLKELDIINACLGGNAVTIDALQKVSERANFKELNRSIKIADLGCGSGDILKKISDWSEKKKISVKLTGYDANQRIIDYACKHTASFPSIEYEAVNVLSEEFKKKEFDLVTCTLFLHHFDDDILSNFLKQLKKQTSTAIIINDIHRHWFAYYSISWLTRLFSRSYMVKYDAKVSVLRAFKKAELEKIIRAAGFTNFSISWKWAFRYQIILWV